MSSYSCRIESRPCRAGGRATLLSAIAALGLSTLTRAAHAGEAIKLPEFSSTETSTVVVALVAGIVSVLMGAFWYSSVKRQSPGTPRMQEVGQAIRDGALAYLRQQGKRMVVLVALVAVGLFFLFQGQEGYTPGLAAGVALFFVLGVGASYLAGYVGMGMATIANQRTAEQARSSFKGALETAFRAGAVSGMMTVGLGLIGACAVFLKFK